MELEDRVAHLELWVEQQVAINNRIADELRELHYKTALLVRANSDIAAEYASNFGRVKSAGTTITGTLRPDQQWVWIDGDVTAVGANAFEETAVADVQVSPSCDLVQIGQSAFRMCKHLKSFAVPCSVNVIGGSAFWGSSIASVTFEPTSCLESIGREAFVGTELESVDFPASLVTIGAWAFYYCGRLARIAFEAESRLALIGGGAFLECRSLRTVELPWGVRDLPGRCFHLCTALESVVLPGQLQKIGGGAFNSCIALKAVTIPASVRTIGVRGGELSLSPEEAGSIEDCTYQNLAQMVGTFQGCAALESVTLAGEPALAEIGERCFAGCSKLRSVAPAAPVELFGPGSFAACAALKELPIGAARQIGESAFTGCSALTSLHMPATLRAIGARGFQDCTALKKVSFAGGRLDLVGDAAFCGCAALKKMRLPTMPKEFSMNAWPAGCNVKCAE